MLHTGFGNCDKTKNTQATEAVWGLDSQTEWVGFEPTRRKTDDLISSQARYDLFDTTPNSYISSDHVRQRILL